MADNSSQSAIDLISEILDKLIDTQQASTEVTTSMKKSIEEAAKSLREVEGQFKNGFRSELKQHITDCLRSVNDQHVLSQNNYKELKEKVERLSEKIEKPWHWVKLILTTVGATCTTVGAIVVLILKLLAVI